MSSPESLSTAHLPDELSVVFVDQTRDAKDAARLAAERRLTDELNTGGRFKRVFNRFWKDRMWSEYYIQKYEREAQANIDAEGNALALDADTEGRQRATLGIINRFQAEDDSVIHEQAGEKRNIIGPESALASEIKDLIRRNVAGEIDDNALDEEKNRVLAAFAEHSDEYAGLFAEGKARVDNMTEIAGAVKAAVEHGESLEDVLNGMKIVLGEARNSVRTEVNYTRVDSIVEKMQKTKLRCLANPEVIATGAAIATGIARFGGSRLTAALCTFAPGLATGVWAGIRENKRVKDERRQHSREMAMGGTIEDGSRRREAMEETRYESVTALSLIDSLNTHFTAEDALASDDAVIAALAALTEAQARNNASDERRADLITYSDAASVGEERFALDLAIAQAKTLARQRIDAEMMGRLGIGQRADIGEAIDLAVADYTEQFIDTDMAAKDKVFRKLKAKRVALAGAAAGIATIASGLVTQELIAGFDATRDGLIDDLTGQQSTPFNGENHQTLLNGFVHGEQRAQHVAPASNYSPVGGTGNLEVSADHTVNTVNGELQFIDANGNITIDHVPVNSDGSLPDSSVDMLRQHGMTVDEAMIQAGTTPTTTTGTAQDFLKVNDATHVKREFWYDNDTTAYDKNELKLWAGGTDGSGVDADGHFAYSVSHMTAEGSSHGHNTAQWRELLDQGKLKIALSATKGTQGDVLMMDLNADGTLDIDPNSPAAQLFENENGRAVFKGAYMEVVEDIGFKDGHEHIRPLATFVGKDSINEFTYVTEEPKYERHFTVTTAGYETPGTFTEAAPGIPLTTRRPLELLAARGRGPTREPIPEPERKLGYYYSGEISSEQEAEIRRQISPRLQRNPDARLHLKQEVEWYRDELIGRRGQEEVNKLESQIDSSRELSELQPEIETIVTIPVAAAKESDNIYQTLSLYGQQDSEALNKSLILINLNWLDAITGSSEEMGKVQRTADEIERARRDFPQLRIAVVRNQYEARKVEATGGVIGYVASDLIDTALLTIRRNIEEGRIKSGQDVTIIRHDADMQGMSRHHLRQFQDSARNNISADLFKGVTRFGVRSSQRYPGFGIATSFSSALSMLHANEGLAHTGGANFGIRAASLAALGGIGRLEYTGPGSDDVELGRRVSVARDFQSNIAPQGTVYGSYNEAQSQGSRGKAYVRPVIGANIDTNPDRLLPPYLEGGSFQDAWGWRFTRGQGGHRDRDADIAITERIKRESTDMGSSLYRFLEKNISFDLTGSDWSVAKRGLAVYFGAEPGLYTVNRDGRGVEFKFTEKGREWVKQRVERESNGRYGSYGMRKMRQLYGDRSHRRQPVPRESPFVSPA